jgi:S1-C subfamily serine protease
VGAVFGHPLGGPLTLSPFKVGEDTQARGFDIYDQHRTTRHIFVLSSDLAPGDSGGALVDSSGIVEGVAFAIAPDQPDVAYALTLDEVKPVLASAGTDAVNTGPCIE